MSESAVSQDDAAKRASEQARLRKERREAKIKAGGSARLNRITGLGGRGKASPSFLVAIPSLFLTCLIEIEPPADSETTASTTATDVSPAAAAAVPSDASAPAPAAHADPDEVDISDHYYEPKMAAARAAPSASAVPAMSEDDLRKMMLGFEAGNTPRQPTPGLAGSGAGLDEDPMMKIMSQLMSGAGFPPGAAADGSSPFPGMFPPGANPFGGGLPAQQPPAPVPTSTHVWRILHALVALGLGLYVVLLTPFAGTKIERDRAALPITSSPDDPFSTPLDATAAEADMERRKQLFFWAFATAESVLLSTRYFLLKQGALPGGVAGTVVGFLPQPYKGYVEIVLRYGQIFTTVRSDMLACIFVLGICAWARG